MNYSFGAKPDDFQNRSPIGVLVQSPLPESSFSRTSLLKFLAVLLGSIRGLKTGLDAMLILDELVEDGMQIKFQPDVPINILDMFVDHESLASAVEKALPELMGRKLRLRPGMTQDFVHGDVPTRVIWVFVDEDEED